MERTSTRRELVSLVVCLIPLVVAAIIAAQRPPSAWNNVDPSVWVQQSLRVSETWNLFENTIDPPLRYVGLAFIYAITDPSPELAGQIASHYAAVFSFILIPLAAYAFLREAASPLVGLLTILAITFERVVGYHATGFMRGAWQYDITLPILFLALLTTHRAIVDDTHRKHAVLTGVLLGIAGLHQLALTGFTVLFASVVFLYHRQIRVLLTTGLVGLPFAATLLLQSERAQSHVPGYAERWALPDSGGLLYGFSEFVFVATAPGNLIVVLSVIVIAGLWRVHGGELSESRTLEISFVLTVAIWGFAKFTRLGYIDWVMMHFGIILIAATGIAVSWRIIRVKMPTIRPVIPESSVARLGGLAVLLTVLLAGIVLRIPGYVPT